MSSQVNPLALDPMQLRTLTLLQALARIPGAAERTPDGAFILSQFLSAYRDDLHSGNSATESESASGLYNEAVWNALVNEGLARATWPNEFALTITGLRYQTGLLHICPEEDLARMRLGIFYFKQGNYPLAAYQFREVIQHHPGHTVAIGLWAECLERIPLPVFDKKISDDVLFYLSLPSVDHQRVADIGARLVMLHPLFQEMTDMHHRSASEQYGLLLAAFNQSLVIALLKKVIISDFTLEQFFIRLRQMMLSTILNAKTPHIHYEQINRLLIALSCQCFSTEYIYVASKQEDIAINNLSEHLRINGVDGSVRAKAMVSVLSCYMPLTRLPNAEALVSYAAASGDPDWQEMIRQQVCEPLAENASRGQISTIGLITDETSKNVQSQYEIHPYPRWTSFDKMPSLALSEHFKSFNVGGQHSAPPITDTPDVLIAGCGTGKHAMQTSYIYRNAHIYAVDLSFSSLAYAKRKSESFGIDNISFMQGDILSLDKAPAKILPTSFDVIECVGVLHHMYDPIEGWRILTRLLKPGGYMKIGLYSALARRFIIKLRQRINELGYSTDINGIRQFRRAIIDLARGDDIQSVLRSKDFFTLSSCRDLLFHVQEHQFSFLQVASIVDELGLIFLGLLPPTLSIKEKFLERFPEDPHAISLANWHHFEVANPDAFAGMYQFWVQKPGSIVSN